MAQTPEEMAMDWLTGKVRAMPQFAPPVDYSKLAEDEWLAAGAPDYIEEALIQPDDVIPFEAAKTAGKGLLALALMGGIKPVGKAAAAYAVPEAVKLAQRRVVEPLGALGDDAVEVAISSAAREAAAKEAYLSEFLPETFYHGTPYGDISEVDPAKARWYDGSFFAAANPEDANFFSKYDYGPDITPAATVLPLKVRGQDFDVVDWAGEDFSINKMKAAIDAAKQKGKPGLYIQQIRNLPELQPTNQVVIFDPSRARSVFAGFDPSRQKEAALLAGTIPLVGQSYSDE